MHCIMRLRLFFIPLISLASMQLQAQNPDLTVELKESVLNKLFAAIGEIKGTSTYSFLFIEGTYQWDLIKPQIKLHPDRADFVTDVLVTVGSYHYTMHITGNVEICYEPTTNLIYVEITEAKFPLNILFFGKIRHLWDVDLASYFETPFTFEGPLTMGTEMIFDMPDGSQKRIFLHPLNCGVKIAEKVVLVSAETEFVERPATSIPIKESNR